MKKNIISIILFFMIIILIWVILSYAIFPIKLSASPGVYFMETMSHMIVVKTSISLLISIFIMLGQRLLSKIFDKANRRS